MRMTNILQWGLCFGVNAACWQSRTRLGNVDGRVGWEKELNTNVRV